MELNIDILKKMINRNDFILYELKDKYIIITFNKIIDININNRNSFDEFDDLYKIIKLEDYIQFMRNSNINLLLKV